MSDKYNLENKSDCFKVTVTCLTSKPITKEMKLALSNRDVRQVKTKRPKVIV